MMTNVVTIQARGLLWHMEDECESNSRGGAMDEIRQGFHEYAVPTGGTFVDIGANVGVVSIYVAKRNPYANVLAVEGFPSNYPILHRNIVRSRLLNITPFPFAIAGAPDPDFQMLYHPSCTGGASHWSAKTEAQGGYKVRYTVAITLDQFLNRYAPEGPIVLKIDTEGSEHVILPPFTQWDRIAHLHLEIHSNDVTRQAGYSSEMLKAMVEEKLPAGATRKYHILEMGV